MRTTMDDWRLLEAYAKNRSEEAFAELVRLHLDWVYSVALRHVGDPHLAEDVVQSVFVLLARKARDLAPGTLLGGWLFRTTRHVASHARRAEQRRKSRETTACTMTHDTNSPDTDETLWEQLAPHLDQAVATLSEVDRSAILLRFYQKMPFRKIGETLGVSEEAAKKRVSRAVEKMREFLDRRGVKLSAVVLAAVLAEKTVQAASAAQAGVVIKIAMAAASASASTMLPQLASETLRAWHWAKVKLGAGLAASLALIFVAVNAGDLVTRHAASQSVSMNDSPLSKVTTMPTDKLAEALSPPIVNDRTPPSAQRPATVDPTATIAAPASNRVIRLHIVHKQTGEDLSKVPFTVKYGNPWEPGEPEPHLTDANGSFDISIPSPEPIMVHVVVRKPGFGIMYLAWFHDDKLGGFPSEYTLPIEPGLHLGGRVLDQDGRAVKGVTVKISPNDEPRRPFESPSSHSPPREWNDEQTTDANGKWQTQAMPAQLNDCRLQIIHPDYIYRWMSAGNSSELLAGLKKGTADITIEPGVHVWGHVLDPEGKPLSGVTVYEGMRDNTDSTKSKTDGEGKFSFDRAFRSAPLSLTVDEKGYAPIVQQFLIGQSPTNIELRLKKGALLTARVVDVIGNPIPDVQINAGGDSGASPTSAPFAIQRSFKTDAGGRFSWNDAPTEPVLFSFYREGFTTERDLSLTAGNNETNITLKPPLHLTGTVTDAAKGEPIPDFTLTLGYPSGSDAHWDSSSVRHYSNGVMDATFSEPAVLGTRRPYQYIVRIEAPGHAPVLSKTFTENDQNQTWNVALPAAAPLRGVIWDSRGGLVSGARIVAITSRDNLQIVDGRIEALFPFPETTSDGSGSFELAPQPADTPVLVTHDLGGFLKTTFRGLSANTNITLSRWGTIVGTIKAGARPVANSDIALDFNDDPAKTGWAWWLTYKTRTDASGNFKFERVPPGTTKLARWIALGNDSASLSRFGRTINVVPGKTQSIVLGEEGRHLHGRLAASSSSREVVWKDAIGTVSATTDKRPPVPASLSGSERQRWFTDWYATEEGKTFKQELEAHSGTGPLQINPDGSFEADTLFSGKNVISVRLFKPQARDSFFPGEQTYTPPILETFVTFDIPSGKESYDVGTIVLHPPEPRKL